MKIESIEIRHYRLPLDPPFLASWDPRPRTSHTATPVADRFGPCFIHSVRPVNVTVCAQVNELTNKAHRPSTRIEACFMLEKDPHHEVNLSCRLVPTVHYKSLQAPILTGEKQIRARVINEVHQSSPVLYKGWIVIANGQGKCTDIIGHRIIHAKRTVEFQF